MTAQLVKLSKSFAACRADERFTSVFNAMALERVRVCKRLSAVAARVRLLWSVGMCIGDMVVEMSRSVESDTAVATLMRCTCNKCHIVAGRYRSPRDSNSGRTQLATVSLQCLLRAEDLSTNVTAEGLQQCHSTDRKPAIGWHGGCRNVGSDTLGGAEVHSHVSLEWEGLRKAFVADEAAVGTDAGMCHHVVTEVVRHGKRTTTDVALVGLLTAVWPRVSL